MRLHGLKASAFSASALAFASFGDAFLYAFLPVNHLAMGIPVVWVGVLLSINRFVRIFTSRATVFLFKIYGFKTVTIIAVITAIISTLGYAAASTIVIWLVCRILWGLSFSAMRLGTLGYAINNARPGLALGISRSLQEAGPMIVLLCVSFFVDRINGKQIFFFLAVLSTPALYFALALPAAEAITGTTRKIRTLKIPSLINSITLLSSILVDGILVVVLGTLFLKNRNISLTTATALAAFYLGYRRLCLVGLSTAGGWIADRFGCVKIFHISLGLMIAGLILIYLGWLTPGLIVLFASHSINTSITPGIIAEEDNNSLAAVSENAMWKDIGAAIGTLLGGFLIDSPVLNFTLAGSTLLLFICFYLRLGKTRLFNINNNL
jgi:MFS transporter, DHA1 family, multidrug resistance protein